MGSKESTTSDRGPTKRARRGRLLKRRERDEFLELLARGVGRTAICRKLGISYDFYQRAREERPEFDEAVRRALEGIDQNVEMALYKSAMEGSVTAQTFWLKNRRPEGWQGEAGAKTAQGSRKTGGAAQAADEDELEGLSDEELIKKARAEGVDLPPEIARRLAQADRQRRSRRVPPKPAD